jgi:hypothetical protein
LQTPFPLVSQRNTGQRKRRPKDWETNLWSKVVRDLIFSTKYKLYCIVRRRLSVHAWKAGASEARAAARRSYYRSLLSSVIIGLIANHDYHPYFFNPDTEGLSDGQTVRLTLIRSDANSPNAEPASQSGTCHCQWLDLIVATLPRQYR